MKAKKMLLSALSIILTVCVLGACSAPSSSSETGVSTTTNTASESTKTATASGDATSEVSDGKGTKNGHVFYDPPITVNLARAIGPDVKFKEGQDINNNEYNDWLLEEFGIKANYIWTTPTGEDAFYTKLMLSISAGEELPEFFILPDYHAHELIESGLVMPIDSLYEQNAGIVWKKAYDDVADCWLPYKRGGETFAYPIADYLYEHEDVMWIRNDWLEAVNMEAPKTLDELRAVMDAFVNLDASVTGFEKVYGITAQLKGNYISWLGVNPVFGMFGTVPQIWMKDGNGDIVYSSTMPQIKDAITEFKDWIDKGYFPPEVGLMDEMSAAELFTSGRAGIAMGPTWLYSWPLQDVVKNIPGASVGVYSIPNGPNGNFLQQGNPNHYQVVMFSKTAKNPQAFFEVINYHYENMTDADIDSPFAWGFKEGYDYVMKGDLPSYLEEDMPGGIVASIFPFSAFNIPSQKVEIASYLASGQELVRPIHIAKNIGWDTHFIQAAQIVLSQKDSVVYNVFTGAPTQTMIDKMPDMTRVQEETFSNMLYGKVGIEEGYNSWMGFWESNGGPKMTEEVREWYKAAGGE